MKNGRSLQELASELHRQLATKKDYMADSRALTLRPIEGNFVLDGVNGGMPLRPIAHAQMADTLKIPKAYYDRMLADAPGLLASNVNHWLFSQPARRMVRTLEGQVRAILSDSYRPLDNMDLAEAVLPRLNELEADVLSSEITEQRFYLKAVTKRVQGEVKRGDVIQAGLAISNSEVGAGALRVEALDYRLMCLNGMIREAAVRKAHLGRSSGNGNLDAIEDAREFFRDETRQADDRAFFLKVRDAVGSMFDPQRFNARLLQYQEVAERPFNAKADPVKVVEVVAKRFDLNDSERSSVLQHLIRGGDMNQWGMANAITRAAQDVDDYDRSTEMEGLGGRVVELTSKDWMEVQKN